MFFSPAAFAEHNLIAHSDSLLFAVHCYYDPHQTKEVLEVDVRRDITEPFTVSDHDFYINSHSMSIE